MMASENRIATLLPSLECCMWKPVDSWYDRRLYLSEMWCGRSKQVKWNDLRRDHEMDADTGTDWSRKRQIGIGQNTARTSLFTMIPWQTYMDSWRCHEGTYSGALFL